MAILTIYTATYNRGKLLNRVYDSLVNQSSKDFIWMIIDDGSTDNTKKMIEKFKNNKNDFEIIYFYKENGGVHTARDYAYDHCNTELIMSVDSDDVLMPKAVEKILKLWKQQGGNNYAGIFALHKSLNGPKSDTTFPMVKKATFQELAYKYKFKGDKTTIIRTSIIKKIPHSPVFKNEKLVSESYKWIQLPEDKPFLLMNEPIKIIEYRDDGYTSSASNNVYINLEGYRALYLQLIISARYMKPKFKGYIGYISCSLLLKDLKFLRKTPKPIMTFVFLPIGIIRYIQLLHRRKTLKHKQEVM